MRKQWRRSRWSAIVALILAAVGFVAVGSGPTLAATTTTVGPWSQSNADAALSRSNPAESVLTARTIARARYLRSVVAEPQDPNNEDDCTGGRFPVPPLLYGGAVYAMAGGWLTKTNASTGAVVWRVRQSSANFFEDLAVSSSGLVVLGSTNCISQSDPGGSIEAFRAGTGARVWSVPGLPSDPMLDHFVLSSGYVVAIGEPAAATPDVVVAVYKVATGEQVWSTVRRVSANCNAFGMRVLVAAGQVVYPSCIAKGSALVARDLATGARTWTRAGAWQLGGANSDSPTAGHHLYAVDSAGNVQDLIPQSGRTRFTLAGATRYLAVDGRRVYGNCGTSDLCAYDQATGARLWVRPGRSTSLAASAGGVLYLADGSVLNAATGADITTLWAGTATDLSVGNGHVAVVVEPRILDLYGLRGY